GVVLHEARVAPGRQREDAGEHGALDRVEADHVDQVLFIQSQGNHLGRSACSVARRASTASALARRSPGSLASMASHRGCNAAREGGSRGAGATSCCDSTSIRVWPANGGLPASSWCNTTP